jgi:hypothetical protein
MLYLTPHYFLQVPWFVCWAELRIVLYVCRTSGWLLAPQVSGFSSQHCTACKTSQAPHHMTWRIIDLYLRNC